MRVAERVNDVWRFSIYDIGGKIVAEYGGVAAADEGGVKYLLSDWQGSTRAVMSNGGFVKARMDYTAYGEEIGAGVGLRTSALGYSATSADSIRQRYGLTERDDATGLDHTWFRKNENRGGRWTSPDPYNGSISLGDPQSFNRFSYAHGQPTNFIDPSGLNSVWCQWWANFLYPDGFDHPETKRQIGNSWLVCRETGGGPSSGTLGPQIELPGGGGTDIRIFDPSDNDRAEQFMSCVEKTVFRIRRDLNIRLDGIADRAVSNAGIAFSVGLLLIVVEVVAAAISGEPLPLLLIPPTIVVDTVAIAAIYTVAVSQASEERRLAQNAINDAWADCATQSNVGTGQAPQPLKPVS